MKKIFLSLLVAAAAFNLQAQNRPKDWANFGKYAEANETVARGAKAVFMGNSITEGWVRTDPSFFTDNNYIGRGISGQVTSQMLVRFRPDVIELQPECVVILAGTNDIAENNGFIAVENIFGNIVSICELAKANGIKAIICSVLPVSVYPWRRDIEDPAGKIIKLNEMLKSYSEKNGIEYVDYHTPMRDEKNGLPKEYANDGVHPTPEGYKIMESLVKPAIDKVTGCK